MEHLHQVLNILNTIPADVWSVVVEIIVSALVVSPLFIGIKKWWNINGEIKMFLLVFAGSFVAAVSAYALTIPQFAPWIILVQGWLIFATTQPVYFLAAKPLFRRLGAWFSDQISKASTINEAKAASVPSGGLPISGTPSPIDDYGH